MSCTRKRKTSSSRKRKLCDGCKNNQPCKLEDKTCAERPILHKDVYTCTTRCMKCRKYRKTTEQTPLLSIESQQLLHQPIVQQLPLQQQFLQQQRQTALSVQQQFLQQQLPAAATCMQQQFPAATTRVQQQLLGAAPQFLQQQFLQQQRQTAATLMQQQLVAAAARACKQQQPPTTEAGTHQQPPTAAARARTQQQPPTTEASTHQQPPTTSARDQQQPLPAEARVQQHLTADYLDIPLLKKQIDQIQDLHVCRVYRDHPWLLEPLQNQIATVNALLAVVYRISVDKPQRIHIAQIFRETIYAFTLNLAQLSWAMLEGYKISENRDNKWKIGWYAVHTGAQSRVLNAKQKKYKVDLRKALPNTMIPNEDDLLHSVILGLAHICDRREKKKCGGCVWATGKWCHIIDMIIKLSRPVYCRGFQGLWRIGNKQRVEIFSQVNDVKISENDLSVLI